MAKHPDHRRLRSAFNYTVSELAQTCGVTEATVRQWLKGGLPALTQQRPTLIVGAVAKEFLLARRARKKRPIGCDELFCMSCKAPRKAFEGMVDLIEDPEHAPRIQGFCAVCENICCRIVKRSEIVDLPQNFRISSSTVKAA